MDNDIRYGLEHFDKVWSRVTAPEQDAKEGAWDELAALRGFIEDETRDGAYYAAMAARCPSAANSFRCMSADERSHLRELQVEYFLMTGSGFAPGGSCPAPGGTLAAMRKAYNGEMEGSEKYRLAAEKTASPELREIYMRHAGDESVHAEKLRGLISRAIG